jgi:hypothetical protein
MGSFFRVDTSKLQSGPARVLYAPSTQALPTQISDVITLTSGSTQYDPKTGWVDLGATRQGVTISVNNTETSFDVDQIRGAVATTPDTWECLIDTRLAEMTLENLVFAWEGMDITTNTTPTPDERQTAFAGATSYTERRMAVVYMRVDGLLTLYSFHRVVRSPQQGQIVMAKNTEQDVQVQFRCLADGTVADPRGQFFDVFDQVAA